MLGCGAHVRIIALPHVRCACGSACGKVFKTACAMCVHAADFGRAMCNRTFAHFFEILKLILTQKGCFKTGKVRFKPRKDASKQEKDVLKQKKTL